MNKEGMDKKKKNMTLVTTDVSTTHIYDPVSRNITPNTMCDYVLDLYAESVWQRITINCRDEGCMLECCWHCVDSMKKI